MMARGGGNPQITLPGHSSETSSEQESARSEAAPITLVANPPPQNEYVSETSTPQYGSEMQANDDVMSLGASKLADIVADRVANRIAALKLDEIMELMVEKLMVNSRHAVEVAIANAVKMEGEAPFGEQTPSSASSATKMCPPWLNWSINENREHGQHSEQQYESEEFFPLSSFATTQFSPKSGRVLGEAPAMHTPPIRGSCRSNQSGIRSSTTSDVSVDQFTELAKAAPSSRRSTKSRISGLYREPTPSISMNSTAWSNIGGSIGGGTSSTAISSRNSTITTTRQEKKARRPSTMSSATTSPAMGHSATLADMEGALAGWILGDLADHLGGSASFPSTRSRDQVTSVAPAQQLGQPATHFGDIGCEPGASSASSQPKTNPNKSSIQSNRSDGSHHDLELIGSNMSNIRKQTVNHIVDENVPIYDSQDSRDHCRMSIGSESLSDNVWLPPMIIFWLCGILPWTGVHLNRSSKVLSQVYQCLVLVTTGIACVSFILPVLDRMKHQVWPPQSLCYSETTCLQIGLLSDLPLALGGFGALISLATYTNSKALSQCLWLLRSYAHREVFDVRWALLTRRDLLLSLLVWLLVLCERLRGTGAFLAMINGTLDAWTTLHIVMFTLSSLLLVALSFLVSHMCEGLVSAIDSFCVVIICTGDLVQAVTRWNAVQAILRKVSAGVQWCLFVLQGTVLLMFLLGALDVYWSMQSTGDGYVMQLIPSAVLALAISRIFFKAASVTDKCDRVPSLINSCGFGNHAMDLHRQYVVQYIEQSKTGFHVFDIRLTSTMALGFAYLCVGCFFVLTTQILSGSEQSQAVS